MSFRPETALFYGFITVSVAFRLRDPARSLPPRVRPWDDSGHLVLGAALLAAAVMSGDPARGLGFGPLGGRFPVWEAAGLFVCLGLSNRIVVGWLERWLCRMDAGGPVERPWAYSVARGRQPGDALTLIPLITGMQTLVEEVVFRGMIRSAASWLIIAGLRGCSLTGSTPVTGLVATWLANAAQASMFGVMHWLPVRLRWRAAPGLLRRYCFWMPFCSGLAFGALNDACMTLWPGWAVHWSLNTLSAVADYARDPRGVGSW